MINDLVCAAVFRPQAHVVFVPTFDTKVTEYLFKTLKLSE